MRVRPVPADHPPRLGDHRRTGPAAAHLLRPAGPEDGLADLRRGLGECYIAARADQGFGSIGRNQQLLVTDLLMCFVPSLNTA